MTGTFITNVSGYYRNGWRGCNRLFLDSCPHGQKMDKKGRVLSMDVIRGTEAASSVVAALDELNVPVFLPERWVVLAGLIILLTQQLVHVPEVPSTGGGGPQ